MFEPDNEDCKEMKGDLCAIAKTLLDCTVHCNFAMTVVAAKKKARSKGKGKGKESVMDLDDFFMESGKSYKDNSQFLIEIRNLQTIFGFERVLVRYNCLILVHNLIIFCVKFTTPDKSEF